MYTTLTLVVAAIAFQTDAPTQVHALAQDSIREGLPAQVVAELARRALEAPSDEQNWAELAAFAGASQPGPSQESTWYAPTVATVSEFAGDTYEAGRSVAESAAAWVSESASANPKTWVGGIALIAVVLMGLRSRTDARHVARTARARPHRSLVWNVRSRAWPNTRRRVGVPKADYLLGRGLTPLEVARQTGLARDLVRLVDFCAGGIAEDGADDVVLHPSTPEGRPDGTADAGRFTRSEDPTPDERASSIVSVIA